ncbi:nucleoside triphosphate pyrophosphatase [uncultured Psychrobacter sp.]|uniref:Maf family protein n=1 Tax=uncultured Psychrobacter sp. TaxID=259303 RepID=UPI00345901CA
MNILLASGSPRRRELLMSAQLDFKVISVDIDETHYDQETPKDYIQRMVATKAEAAITQLQTDDQNHTATIDQSSVPFVVLTADTIGVLPDGQSILVKPIDRDHAYNMWQQMSDDTHQVWTAVQATLVDPALQVLWQQQIIERTEVTFVPLTPAMMASYWDSDEPADKAGGYAIQGQAAAWVTRINGSYTNVVGLPLAQTLALIKSASNSYESHCA